MPTGASRERKRDEVLALCAAAVVAVVWWRVAWICDDAYLVFRTIEVWFAGDGPNFNPGHRIWVRPRRCGSCCNRPDASPTPTFTGSRSPCRRSSSR
jgi:hypothetical protein